MHEQENQNSGSELGGGVNASSGDTGAVDSASLTLAELNKVLGKEYKDKDSALKSLADTNSYVGKLGQELAVLKNKGAETDPSLLKEVQALKETVFYSEHPQFKDYADVIRRMGGNPAEVVDSPEFKKVFEMGQKATEADSKKSVVSSNSRIASPPSVLQEAVAIANNPGSGPSEIASVFAKEIAEQLRGS